ncbi:MAG TPA: class I SAM-dependent methyltransferase, partial [Labilithrix sp.]|nr:class I SAM-dependent methyltransferase [Labilithrix sp.]
MDPTYSGSFLDWPTAEEGDTGEVYARYAEVYDAFFGDIRNDAMFYLKRAAEHLAPGGSVLEIGSGTGRVAERFLREGYRVTGVDASTAMLSRASQSLAEFGDRYTGVHADVRTMTLPERFRLAVAPYGMVAHLLSNEDRLATFRRVREHLVPGGVFIFDDMPGWLATALGAEAADGGTLELRKTTTVPDSSMT